MVAPYDGRSAIPWSVEGSARALGSSYFSFIGFVTSAGAHERFLLEIVRERPLQGCIRDQALAGPSSLKRICRRLSAADSSRA